MPDKKREAHATAVDAAFRHIKLNDYTIFDMKLPQYFSGVIAER